MQRFTVSRDDRYHEAWPSICVAADGNLVCSYAEADRHGGGAVPSAVVRISDDEGGTWSQPIVVDTLMDRPASGYFMCRSIVRLLDGTLLLAADWNRTESIAGPSERWYAHRGLPWNWTFDRDSGPLSEAWLYRSLDHGRTWSGPEKTGCLTTSLNLRQISDGTLFLSGGHFRTAGEYEEQVLYRSEDAGRTWSDPISVVDDRRLLCSEGDLVELPDGTLVLYIRCDNNPARTGMKALSSDGGRSWDGPYAAGYWPIIGRVNAGLLSSGEVLVVHRMGGFAPQHWFGYFIEDRETALARPPNRPVTRRNPPATVWGTIDNDTSPHADHGYGDWVELPGGDVYVVNYLVDDAPVDRPQIRGYRIPRDELFLPRRNQKIDFAPPEYRRGKLAGQAGWVRQIPALWGTTEWLERVDYGPLGNYVVIDGERMTGSRNLGGNEEVVRLDVGPYDLERETVALTLVHRGRQRVAIVRLADQDANTIVELRSDSVYDDLWLRDNRSVPYRSGVAAGTGVVAQRHPPGRRHRDGGHRNRERPRGRTMGHRHPRRLLPAPLGAGRDRDRPGGRGWLLRGQHRHRSDHGVTSAPGRRGRARSAASSRSTLTREVTARPTAVAGRGGFGAQEGGAPKWQQNRNRESANGRRTGCSDALPAWPGWTCPRVSGTGSTRASSAGGSTT